MTLINMEHDTLCLIFSDSTSLANFIKKAGYKIKGSVAKF